MATGIKDKVAIIGMGCTKFGERWDVGAEELMVEAFTECLEDAGIDRDEIQAAWQGTYFEEINVGKSALPLSTTLRLPFIPVTRTENFCASGTEAFRGAVYAVASGAYDICLALGVEKLKDTGYGGLLNPGSNWGSLSWLWWPNVTAPGAFAQLASAYAAKYGIPDSELKRAMAHVSVKSHANGALNPKAHLRNPVTEDQVMGAPIIAHPLGLFDCCGVSDGAACALVTTVEKAKDMGYKDFVTVKADGDIDIELARKALDTEGIDIIGLDSLDRKFLKVIIEYYKGGPVGIEAIGATLNEEIDTLVDMVEPYLLKIGFLQRTKRGRMVSRDACNHLGIKISATDQPNLFE